LILNPALDYLSSSKGSNEIEPFAVRDLFDHTVGVQVAPISRSAINLSEA
jgi:hypothetical protein